MNQSFFVGGRPSIETYQLSWPGSHNHCCSCLQGRSHNFIFDLTVLCGDLWWFPGNTTFVNIFSVLTILLALRREHPENFRRIMPIRSTWVQHHELVAGQATFSSGCAHHRHFCCHLWLVSILPVPYQTLDHCCAMNR